MEHALAFTNEIDPADQQAGMIPQLQVIEGGASGEPMPEDGTVQPDLYVVPAAPEPAAAETAEEPENAIHRAARLLAGTGTSNVVELIATESNEDLKETGRPFGGGGGQWMIEEHQKQLAAETQDHDSDCICPGCLRS
ncbi:MAG TPA: hypothetical protein VHA37_08260 [Candidatus Saccharimonadales bacterium]|nr:hypothetical protein [Candidatus Saccharimonadales bacterium]